MFFLLLLKFPNNGPRERINELMTEIYFLSPKRTPRCGAIVVVVIVNVVADDEEKHVSKFVASSRQANVDASIEKYMP